MAEDVIQSFLVALGFTVKQDQQRQFTNALAGAKTAALALAASLTGVVATIAKVAEGYEALYYQSQRVGAAVQNIQALRYELAQVGGSAAGASAALEGIGTFLRSSPNAEGFFQRLGIQTRDANGSLRDTTALLHDFAQQAKTMPFYRAAAYGQVLGIDQNTLMALMRDTGAFGAQLKAMYRAAGIDGQQAAAGSAAFMQELRGLGAALQVLRDKVALSLEKGVGGDIARLRMLLVANFGRISAVILEVTRFIVGLGWALITLVERAAGLVGDLVDWFDGLDRGTRRWVEGIGLLTAAWYLLSRGFLASPLGRVIALGVALLGLYDDYKTFKEGGKSLIDWKQWEPGIEALLDSVHTIEGAFKDMWPAIKGYVSPLLDFLKHELVQGMKDAMLDVQDLVQAADDSLHGRWASARGHLAAIGSREAASSRDDLAAANVASGGVLAGSASRALDHSASDDALGLYGDHVNGLTRSWRYLSGQTSRAEGSGFDILTGLGLDRTHALALLGNFRQESDLDPDARNGHHYGIEQWSDDRADALKTQTGIDVRTAGYADQLKAAVWEITAGNERGHAQAFFNAEDLTSATEAFAGDVERSGEKPGMPGFGARIAYAHQADQRLRFAAGGNATINAGGSPRVTQTNNITVNGAASPDATARSVLRHQDYASEALIRNMGPLNQ